MKNKLHFLSIVLIALISFTSCNRQSYPQFSGHYKPTINQPVLTVNRINNRFLQKEIINPVTQKEIFVINPAKDIIGIKTEKKNITEVMFVNSSTEKNIINTKNNKSIAIQQKLISNKPVAIKTEKIIPRKEHSKITNGNQLLCAIIAIFIPPLGVVLYEEKLSIHFWISLLLTILFYLPGLIYSLIIILGT